MSEAKADTFLNLIRNSQRGRLKIYLGYCAGVGKTYQMLQEAQRLRREGLDVVLGVIETYDRPETKALLEGLEVIPRRKIMYHGQEVGEMDVDAIVARHPAVVLVDELAHTNVVGSKNTKRYQDVEELLAAGIHVITTMNLQHLESLFDLVEKATGVKVRDRVPDKIVAMADQLVNVDITAEDLCERLRQGKIYTSDKISSALDGLFQLSNLEQLREMTLRELAAQLDSRRRNASNSNDNVTSPDQVMVCLSSKGPNSDLLLRYASRLAGRLNRNWYAVYVQTAHEKPGSIDVETQRIIGNTLTLAQQLGATVFTYKGDDVAAAILQFAHEYRVGHIVIGSPGRKRGFFSRLFRGPGIVERLIEDGHGLTVVVLDTRRYKEEQAVVAPSAPAPVVKIGNALTALLGGLEAMCWDDTADKETVLRSLLAASCHLQPGIDQDAAWENLCKRENQGATFLGKDIALPHARIDGIIAPILMVGMIRNGIFDWNAEEPIRIVFFLLSPAQMADVHVKVLGQLSRLAHDDILMQQIKKAGDAAEIFQLISEWQEKR